MSLLGHLRQDVVQSYQTSVYMINSYREYLKKQKTKIIEWINSVNENTRNNSSESITIPMNYLGRDALYNLTKTNYAEALEGNSQTLKVVTYNGTDVQADKTADDILSSFENTVSDLTTQDIFLDYLCQAGETVSTNEFLTRITAMSNGIASASYSLYTSILDASNDKFEALKAFFTSQRDTQVINQGYNNTINIVKLEDYNGNIWTAVFSQIVDEITSLVSTVTTAISKMQDLFTNIVKSLGAIAAWTAKKLFANLATDFEKTKGIGKGILDMPLLQVNLTNYGSTPAADRDFIPNLPVFINDTNLDESNYVTKIWNFSRFLMSDDWLPSSTKILVSAFRYPDRDNYGIANFTRFGIQYGRMRNMPSTTICSIVNDFIKKTIELSEDGVVGYRRVLELVIPWVKSEADFEKYTAIVPDFIIRFGWDSNDDLIMQLFCAVDANQFSSYSDEDINRYLADSQDIEKSLAANLEAWFPYHPDLTWTADNLISKASSVYTNSFIEYLSDACSTNNNVYTTKQRALFGALILFSIANVTGDTGFFHYYAMNNLMFDPYDTNLTEFTARENAYGHTTIKNEILAAWNNETYRPYSNETLTSTAIHYQTLAERAHEVVNILNVIFVAAVVAITAYKVSKWVKNRRIKADLIQGQYDSLTWNYYQASDSQKPVILNQIRKARKKKTHIDRLNNVLGISSSTDTQTSLLNNSFSILENMVGNNGKPKDYSADFTSIEDLIH